MKKALLLIMFSMLLTACTGYNESKYITEGSMGYELSTNRSQALAKDFFWDGDESNTVIDIPAELSDGTPVKKLGGFIGIGVPASFEIKFDNAIETVRLSDLSIVNADAPTDGSTAPVTDTGAGTGSAVTVTDAGNADDSKEEAVVVYKDIVFTVNVGRNVAKMGVMVEYNICYNISSYGIRQDDGTVLAYRPTLYFNVAPLNTAFYAEDGVLYKRDTGEPVMTGQD